MYFAKYEIGEMEKSLGMKAELKVIFLQEGAL